MICTDTLYFLTMLYFLYLIPSTIADVLSIDTCLLFLVTFARLFVMDCMLHTSVGEMSSLMDVLLASSVVGLPQVYLYYVCMGLYSTSY